MDSTALYGPEVFEFCGGWVEVWIKRVQWQNELLLKVSPPDGIVWEVANGHIVIAKENNQDESYKFNSFETMKVQKGQNNTHIWKFDAGNPSEFKVALLPFTGCQIDQKAKGVVLKESKD